MPDFTSLSHDDAWRVGSATVGVLAVSGLTSLDDHELALAALSPEGVPS